MAAASPQQAGLPIISKNRMTLMDSYALEEGIRGWATSGEEYVKMMDGYEASVWN